MNDQDEKRVWNEAIDSVLELLRIHPPHRIGEAAFMRRLVSLKQKIGRKNENSTVKHS